MYRHLSAPGSRNHRPGRAGRNAFTLVELLVVIAIIAMLVGLLIPAVMRAREAGRRAQCLNNQQQIGKAVINYVTAKNKFPPLFSVQPQPTGPGSGPIMMPAPAVGWVPPMLPYLEQNPFYQIFQANQWASAYANKTSFGFPTAICPSRNPTNSLAPLSYAVNAGSQDFVKTTALPLQPLDYQENGIFFDNYSWTYPGWYCAKPPTSDLTYVSKHDGTAMTVLLSENLDARDWIDPDLSDALTEFDPPQPTGSFWGPVWGSAWWQAITWSFTRKTPPDPYTPNWGINRFVGDPPTDGKNARPSSAHPGGAIITMCDGSSRFISEQLDFRVYCLLMAPNNREAKWYDDGTTVQYPKGPITNWYLSTTTTPGDPIRPLTEADLNP